MATGHKRARAKRDLVERYVYLAEHAGIETAERFLSSAWREFQRSKLARLRKWRVSGFEKSLIFYLPRLDGVSTVRVLHAAQDWWTPMNTALIRFSAPPVSSWG